MRYGKRELLFTWLLILACILVYGAVLIPSASDVLNVVSFVIALALFVAIVARRRHNGGTKEADYGV